MKKTKRALALLLALALSFAMMACQGAGAPAKDDGSKTEGGSGAQGGADDDAQKDGSGASAQMPTQDRSGAAIQLPAKVEKVVALAPSIVETLIDLGCADRIIAIDTQTQGYAYQDLAADLPAFDMMTPDTEQLANLKPDVVIISGIPSSQGTDPYADLKELGVCVVSIPSSDSIQGIKDDVAFLAACMGKTAEGEKLIADMTAEIEKIAEIGKTITEKKTVYFEIAADPYEYSFGTGTYMHEMIELIGATNVFADQESWISVTAENIIAANPDVIITNVNYVENPVQEILGRKGWEGVTAVKDSAVYYVDSQSSSLPNENIVKALKEMAAAVYPDAYGK